MWVVAGMTILMVPIGAATASASARSAPRPAATVPPAGISPACAPGSTQFTFANTSGRADAAVFLATETPGNSVVSQSNFNGVSVPLRDPVTNQPNFYVSSADATGHSF